MTGVNTRFILPVLETGQDIVLGQKIEFSNFWRWQNSDKTRESNGVSKTVFVRSSDSSCEELSIRWRTSLLRCWIIASTYTRARATHPQNEHAGEITHDPRPRWNIIYFIVNENLYGVFRQVTERELSIKDTRDGKFVDVNDQFVHWVQLACSLAWSMSSRKVDTRMHPLKASNSWSCNLMRRGEGSLCNKTRQIENVVSCSFTSDFRNNQLKINETQIYTWHKKLISWSTWILHSRSRRGKLHCSCKFQWLSWKYALSSKYSTNQFLVSTVSRCHARNINTLSDAIEGFILASIMNWSLKSYR